MSMAVYDAGLVQTVSGNGFLFEGTNSDMAAYIFSREPVVRMLEISLLAQIAGQVVMKTSQPHLLPNMMRRTHMDGYVHTASGWLEFDLSWALPNNMTVPTLYLLPEYDQDIGYTRMLMDREIQRMPSGLGEVIGFPGHSHCMIGEKGGAQKMAEAALAFFDRHAGS
jgi:pimeloyl-ACP methyl ester carboxylesterase